MTTIFVVAPYPRFAEMFAEVFATHRDGNADADGESGEEYVLEMLVEHDQEKVAAMRPSGDVIIARSFSATLLSRNQAGIPVVDVSILPYDILRCVKTSRQRHGDRKIVLLGTHDMAKHVRALSEFLDLDVEVVEMPSNMGKEPEKAFARIQGRDCVVIGGKITYLKARELGYPALIIESGPEAMQVALSEAKRVARIRRRERERAQSLKTILDCNADGIIALDRQGQFTSMNAVAETMLGLDAESAAGKTAAHFFPNTQLAAMLADPAECVDEVATLGGKPLALNKTGIFLGGERIGAVATLQYVAKIQRSEKTIRNKIMERGLIAKHTFTDIYGKSTAIRAAVQAARKFGQVDSNLLIAGRNGTGKELFAQSIHNDGLRLKGPFVAINCAAIPANLLESELFGYVEGAFTGASKGGKAGLMELAHGGTLFLDEIGEMPLALQGRLLRVLQEREIMRLGGDKVTHVDIRVISATNRDLFELVAEGAFREDLYYRLAVLTLTLPSLAERREDIPGLVRLFLGSGAARLRRQAVTVSAEGMEYLCGLEWGGNIRELQNACEQLAVLGEKECLELADVKAILGGKAIRDHASSRRTVRPEALPAQLERRQVEELLTAGYAKQAIARRLGVNRTTLWRKMRLWGLE